MTEFTPLESLIGGGMIGLAAILLMALHGRIAGITGILSGLLPPVVALDWTWRLAFIAGMVASPIACRLIAGGPAPFESTIPSVLLIVSGIIVGVGVTYGSGCTSGHGVCGIARLSPRSIAATLVFIATAVATVFILRHVLGT